QLLKRKVDKYYRQLQNEFSPAQAFGILEQFRILAPHRKGPWGAGYINELIEQMLKEGKGETGFRTWYAGKPIIVNTNDYSLGLYNGDIGLCLPNAAGELRVFFKTEDHFKEILPARLPGYSTAYALTIHKSQGSEFNRLLLILPASYSRIVSRELIYTAITRARTGVEVVGTKKSLREGIRTKLQRISGLSERLWDE
ncbi:MAG TPA: ATP-binding domain-containing protein, partial [Fodinibius sp.]|nr:ATP-binding domain-containing protein [Fodinibius sp.]